MMSRNVRTIDLEAIRANVTTLKAAVPAGVMLMAVVKADAYGHGSVETARAAVQAGADWLAVAAVLEGLRLREAGITQPVLVLGPVTAGDVRSGVAAELTQSVCAPWMVEKCAEAAQSCGKPALVHLKVDTGMGRVGVRTRAERDGVLACLQGHPEVSLTGAFTHFADADGDEDGQRFTKRQFALFRELTDDLPGKTIRHCSNSAAIHRNPDMALDMVRAGISMYGYPPVETPLRLQPCMRWTAKVNFVKDFPAGEPVSYGRTWYAGGPCRIATVTCGYGDGYHRLASGRAEVLVHGKRCPVVGRICMDQMMVDVTAVPETAPGDEVVLMGESGEERITAEDIALWSRTISYEVLLSAGSRVERVYLHE